MTQLAFTFSRPRPSGAERGAALRDNGVARAAEAQEELVATARRIAARIAQARPEGDVTADDVARALAEAGLPPLGNAAGALFRGGEWEFTGRWRASDRASNHAHQNRVWRWRGAAPREER